VSIRNGLAICRTRSRLVENGDALTDYFTVRACQVVATGTLRQGLHVWQNEAVPDDDICYNIC